MSPIPCLVEQHSVVYFALLTNKGFHLVKRLSVSVEDKIRSIDGPKPPPAPSLKQLRNPKATLLAAGQVVESVLRELGIWDTLILSMTSDMDAAIASRVTKAARKRSLQRKLDHVGLHRPH